MTPGAIEVEPFGTTWSLAILNIAGKDACRNPCATFLRSFGKAGPSSSVIDGVWGGERTQKASIAAIRRTTKNDVLAMEVSIK